MTLLLAKGWDDSEPHATEVLNFGSPGRTGGQYMTINATTGLARYSFTPSTELFYTYWIYPTGSPLAAADFVNFISTDGVTQLNVRISTGRILSLRRAGVTLVTGTNALTLNQWLRIDVQMTCADSGGIFSLYVNGVLELSFAGDTRASGVALVDRIELGTYNQSWRYDDLVICNSLGSVNNGFIGNASVKALFPSGAGDSTEWSPTTANPNWQNMGSPTGTGLQDANFTHASGDLDRYALDDLGVDSTNIKGVVVTATTKRIASTKTVKLSAKSGASVSESAAVAPTAAWGIIDHVVESDPATAAAWTRTAVNAMSAGVETV